MGDDLEGRQCFVARGSVAIGDQHDRIPDRQRLPYRGVYAELAVHAAHDQFLDLALLQQ